MPEITEKYDPRIAASGFHMYAFEYIYGYGLRRAAEMQIAEGDPLAHRSEFGADVRRAQLNSGLLVLLPLLLLPTTTCSRSAWRHGTQPP